MKTTSAVTGITKIKWPQFYPPTERKTVVED